MSLSVDAVKTAAAKKGSRGKRVGVRVTEKVAARAEAEELAQLCISIHGDDATDEHRGLVTVTLDDGDAFQIYKNDTHAAWATKQGEQVDDFVGLFNRLLEAPNKFQGRVEIG